MAREGISRRTRQSRGAGHRQRADDGRAGRRNAARRPRGVGGVAARLCRAETERPDQSLLLRRQAAGADPRSEEHTSELQSLMRISYAVFCLKKNNNHIYYVHITNQTSVIPKRTHIHTTNTQNTYYT